MEQDPSPPPRSPRADDASPKEDKSGPCETSDAAEYMVLVEISPNKHDEIERMARLTGLGARRMLDRLIEHGMDSWHEARRRGWLTHLW